jgi:hypothetical protein
MRFSSSASCSSSPGRSPCRSYLRSLRPACLPAPDRTCGVRLVVPHPWKPIEPSLRHHVTPRPRPARPAWTGLLVSRRTVSARTRQYSSRVIVDGPPTRTCPASSAGAAQRLNAVGRRSICLSGDERRRSRRCFFKAHRPSCRTSRLDPCIAGLERIVGTIRPEMETGLVAHSWHRQRGLSWSST